MGYGYGSDSAVNCWLTVGYEALTMIYIYIIYLISYHYTEVLSSLLIDWINWIGELRTPVVLVVLLQA